MRIYGTKMDIIYHALDTIAFPFFLIGALFIVIGAIITNGIKPVWEALKDKPITPNKGKED